MNSWRKSSVGVYGASSGVEKVPIAQWAADNNYTVRESERLLQAGYLVGMRLKGKMFVAVNPCWVGKVP